MCVGGGGGGGREGGRWVGGGERLDGHYKDFLSEDLYGAKKGSFQQNTA